MSKRAIGRYATGEIKHMYFRRRRHHRTTLNGFRPIRRIMWIAKQIAEEASFYSSKEYVWNGPCKPACKQ